MSGKLPIAAVAVREDGPLSSLVSMTISGLPTVAAAVARAIATAP